LFKTKKSDHTPKWLQENHTSIALLRGNWVSLVATIGDLMLVNNENSGFSPPKQHTSRESIYILKTRPYIKMTATKSYIHCTIQRKRSVCCWQDIVVSIFLAMLKMHERTISKNRFLRTWDSSLVHFKHGQNVKYDNNSSTTHATFPLNSATDVKFLCDHFDLWSDLHTDDSLFVILAFLWGKFQDFGSLCAFSGNFFSDKHFHRYRMEDSDRAECSEQFDNDRVR
jgi:hypothetical protein